MKKKVLALALAMCMMVTAIGNYGVSVKAEVYVVDPVGPVGIEEWILWEGNWATCADEYALYYATDGEPIPGQVVNPGDALPYEAVFLTKDISLAGLATNKCNYMVQEASEFMSVFSKINVAIYGGIINDAKGILAGYAARDSYFDEYDYITELRDSGITLTEKTVIPALNGYTGWKCLCWTERFDIYVPYGEVSQGCFLTKAESGVGMQWYDEKGNLVMDIQENEDSINANFTNQCALSADLIKNFNEADKDILVSYMHKGLFVSADIPAGELAQTNDEWQGAERFADLNRGFITVKNVYGQEVDIDELFK